MAYIDEQELTNQLFEELKNGHIKDIEELKMKREQILNSTAIGGRVRRFKRGTDLLVQMLPKIGLVLVVAIVVYILKGRAPIKQESYSGLSVRTEPVQATSSEKAFAATYGDTSWNIEPQAEYKLVAQVKSKHRISSGQDLTSSIGRYDLALAWGELVDPKYDDFITYDQYGRSYWFQATSECPLDISYITTHSANTHVIAATDKVLQGIKGIKKKDIIYMEGYLVNVSGIKAGQAIEWNSSLSRSDNDVGQGCEVFYVKKLRVGERVYE